MGARSKEQHLVTSLRNSKDAIKVWGSESKGRKKIFGEQSLPLRWYLNQRELHDQLQVGRCMGDVVFITGCCGQICTQLSPPSSSVPSRSSKVMNAAPSSPIIFWYAARTCFNTSSSNAKLGVRSGSCRTWSLEDWAHVMLVS